MASTKSLPTARTLVLCFDGTDEQFQTNNTNVIKLFGVLEKDSDEQLIYYQPGVGTYAAPGVMAGIQSWFAKLIDEAVAWYLDLHVMGGYNFLMQNYREGDRICLFGFSRGAYTARALAGMLYKVGLLPLDNIEQVGFAYNIYKKTGKKNMKLAAEFKETFSKPISIEFVGCWDTVSSVGLLFSRHFPFTTGNSSIKYFRHALALDEHRAKFQPNLFHRASPNAKAASKDPEHASYPTTDPTGPCTDILEKEKDIGGSTTTTGLNTPCLSDITLRWMIRQIVISQCGVLFNSDALAAAGIPLSMLSSAIETSIAEKTLGAELTVTFPSPLYSPAAAQADSTDSTQPIHDALKTQPLWWILEVIPFFVSWQDSSGVWHRSWRWNLGRPRQIYDPTPNLHITVQERIQDTSLQYTPRAVWKNKPNAREEQQNKYVPSMVRKMKE
ncbi:hypothetical protein Clacol_002238 [Clathrus columnatus]|uniref:T6SS Phospholipase effector Tle1-like catalytic domain-containing protein n=1 Tax=Clathrus columnatus TaxID=1419009 RepID=A0AAV5A632_9AGAM|nr:hypothetical protein Clacol_002238 [Clathrus columnatus]